MFKNSGMNSEIERVVKDYFQGYLKAEPQKISSAFHQDSRLLAAEEGALEKTEVSDWLKSIKERQEKGDIREAAVDIAGIDFTGDAAVVKTVLRFPKFQFTDYLSLLKIKGAWKIVNKIYTVENF